MSGSNEEPIWEIIFFRKSNGRYPTRDFLEDLPRDHMEYVIWFLRRLGRHGKAFLTRPYAGYLEDKIWELRPITEQVQYRVLGFRDGARFITCQGFRKKSDEVPPGEIAKAVEYREEYFSRESSG